MNHSRLIATVAGGLVAVGAVAALSVSALNPFRPGAASAFSSGSSAAVSRDRKEVEAMVLEALVIEQNVGADEPSTWGLKQAPSLAAANAELRGAPVPTASTAALRSRAWHQRVGQVFSGKAVRERLLHAVAMNDGPNQDPNGRDFGGGVSAIHFTSEVIGARTATVEARATVWASGAIRNYGHWFVSVPSGDSIVRAQLAKDTSGGWTVTEMVSSSPDGSGP
jgi:hypothetical protein